MLYKLAKSFGFGIFLGVSIHLIEKYTGHDNLTVFLGLIIFVLALLLVNMKSNMNYSLTLPDALWTNFKSKIIDKKGKDSKDNTSNLIIVSLAITLVGLIL